MSSTHGNFFCKKCGIAFPGDYKPQQRPRKSCPKCHKMADLQRKTSPQGKPSKVYSSSDKQKDPEVSKYLDDPDELLLSTAIRELNKPNPDPRWATILINCKKEKITTKKDVLDQFKQLPTLALVNILNKSLREGHSAEDHQQ